MTDTDKIKPCTCRRTNKRARNSNANIVIPDPNGSCPHHNV